MQVSFIIPLYNCLALTQECLRTLQATLPAGLAHEIILVDDGSTDGTREWLAGLCQPAVSLSHPPPVASGPCRALLNDRNLGFAATCNRGAAEAAGELLFFLNNDLLLLPHWLEPMLGAFDRSADAGLVGNVQLNAATGSVDHSGIFFNSKGKPQHDTTLPFARHFWPAANFRPVEALTGACFGVRRAVWQKLGGFDEKFVNGSEDIDLCLRARAAGLRHYIALRSVVRHHISASPGRNLRNEQNTFRLVLRWQDQIARQAARDWSRQQIIIHADQSGVFDYAMIFAALSYWLVLSVPPSRVRQGVAAAMALEQQRWRELFEGAPALPAPVPIRTDQI